MYVLARQHFVKRTKNGKRRYTSQALSIAAVRTTIRLLMETGATEELQKIVEHQARELRIVADEMPILHQMLIIRQRLLQHLGANQLRMMLGQCYKCLEYTGLGTRHIT